MLLGTPVLTGIPLSTCSAWAPCMPPGHGAHCRQCLCSHFFLERKLQELGRKSSLQQRLVVGQPCSCPDIFLWFHFFSQKCQGCDGAAVWLPLPCLLNPMYSSLCDTGGFPALPSVTSIRTALPLDGVCFSEPGERQSSSLTLRCSPSRCACCLLLQQE